MQKKTKLALINAAIAGGLVFFGSFSTGHISAEGIIAAVSASIIIFLTKMREYIGMMQNKKAIKGAYFEFI